MIKIILKKTSIGYKIMVSDKSYSYIRKSKDIKNKYGIYPKQVIGYILKKSYMQYNNDYIFALDMNQLNLWILLGAQFSSSFYKFSYFFRNFLKKSYKL